MRFKEFFVQQDFSKMPSMLGSSVKKFAPMNNVLKTQTSVSLKSPIKSSHKFKNSTPDDPIKFLQRGAGFAKTTGKGFQI